MMHQYSNQEVDALYAEWINHPFTNLVLMRNHKAMQGAVDAMMGATEADPNAALARRCYAQGMQALFGMEPSCFYNPQQKNGESIND